MASKIRYTAGAFRLEHICGHEEIHELTGGHATLVEKIADLEAVACSECIQTAAELAAEAAEQAAAPVVESPEVAAVAEVAAISAIFTTMRRTFVPADWEGPEHLYTTLVGFCDIMAYPVPSRAAVDAFWSAA